MKIISGIMLSLAICVICDAGLIQNPADEQLETLETQWNKDAQLEYFVSARKLAIEWNLAENTTRTEAVAIQLMQRLLEKKLHDPLPLAEEDLKAMKRAFDLLQRYPDSINAWLQMAAYIKRINGEWISDYQNPFSHSIAHLNFGFPVFGPNINPERIQDPAVKMEYIQIRDENQRMQAEIRRQGWLKQYVGIDGNRFVRLLGMTKQQGYMSSVESSMILDAAGLPTNIIDDLE